MFTPRMYVKDHLEQWAGSIAHKVRLEFAGWRPKPEPDAEPGPSASAARKKPSAPAE